MFYFRILHEAVVETGMNLFIEEAAALDYISTDN
jgi:hypothetical protein